MAGLHALARLPYKSFDNYYHRSLLSGAALTPCRVLTGSHVVLCGYETASPHLYTGLFQIDDTGDCLQANPATGDCQCDGGSKSVAGIWRANVDAARTWKGSNIVSCLAAARDAAPAAPLSSSSDALQISGMYQHDDAVAGGKGCRSVNPFTGNCSYTPFPPPSPCIVVHCCLTLAPPSSTAACLQTRFNSSEPSSTKTLQARDMLRRRSVAC